jgi:hypothetical protein
MSGSGRRMGLNLAAARLRPIAGTAWFTKRYLTMSLPSQRTEQALTA